MTSEHYQFDLSEGDVISLERLLCIFLYTDYTNLSGQFTSTFRKRNTFEPLKATKRRHINYYWMGRLLKETVFCYGKFRSSGLSGPFFCGMSMVMNMPQFNIQLLSPVSTSIHIEVAMKFSGDSGIIIEFDNTKGYGGSVVGLDVSWLSRFHEEDERYR